MPSISICSAQNVSVVGWRSHSWKLSFVENIHGMSGIYYAYERYKRIDLLIKNCERMIQQQSW
jgi:hypothetical protein